MGALLEIADAVLMSGGSRPYNGSRKLELLFARNPEANCSRRVAFHAVIVKSSDSTQPAVHTDACGRGDEKVQQPSRAGPPRTCCSSWSSPERASSRDTKVAGREDRN